MNKIEFLDILREALSGEVSAEVIEQNINYYKQYISSQTPEEEEDITQMLGDPRLIAKTVIEKERAAKQREHSDEAFGSNRYSGPESENHGQESSRNVNQRTGLFYTNLTWIQKLILIVCLIVVFLVVILIGRIIIGFVFVFGVPIILAVLLFVLFKKRN